VPAGAGGGRQFLFLQGARFALAIHARNALEDQSVALGKLAPGAVSSRLMRYDRVPWESFKH
jgi:hypothetical protein